MEIQSGDEDELNNGQSDHQLESRPRAGKFVAKP
jgi:hypothetical protein